jgi:D-serine deaminase-like pyridoxal phosphate-dependent protein
MLPETPAALVDLDRMEANLRSAAEYCRSAGLAWRPHAKTHKSPVLAARQVAAGASGVTVATVREAEVMATTVDDVLLAYPPIGAARARRLMALPERVRLTVALDSLEALAGLSAAAHEAGREVGVLVELDLGMRRVGVAPADAPRLAAAADRARGVAYRGILFYPGHVREPPSAQGPALEAIGRRLAGALDALERAGLTPEMVSGGSTPTFRRSHEIPGLTEVRPGTLIFNDRTTAEIGACAWDECAYSVLSTVVSTAVPGQAVIDAGAKALAREELRPPARGYGALLDRPEVLVSGLSEEHGILDPGDTAFAPRIGERVRVVPNHVCVSVNLQERLYGIRGGEVVEVLEVARGR